MRKENQAKKYLRETQRQFNSIDTSREVYSAIRKANKTLRKLKAQENGVPWSESPKGWSWVRWKLTELLESLGFELWLLLRKVLFGLSVLVGWILVLGLVIVWLGGFK